MTVPHVHHQAEGVDIHNVSESLAIQIVLQLKCLQRKTHLAIAEEKLGSLRGGGRHVLKASRL
jgi:hypothetical protein